MYEINYYRDGSRIGVSGVKKFVQKDWPALKEINLGLHFFIDRPK